jgi:hypothetical protein
MFAKGSFCTLSCAAESRVALRKRFITVVALLTAGLVAGCGGGSSKTDPPAASSSAAHKLLVQTFDGHHTITSGVISLEVKVAPSGSSTIKGPFELSFGGPFTSGGAGKAPESDFTVAITGQGHRGLLQVISAGGKGYIAVSGQSYEMPASNFKSVESGLGSLAHAGGASGAKSGTNVLGKLGIRPLDWLSDPQIMPSGATVGGVATTWVHATVDTTAMLQDLNKLLGKAGSLGIGGTSSLPKSISASTQKRIAKALGSPTFDVWTGKSDQIVRDMMVHATIPITGQTRTRLGGMTSASVSLEFSYSDVNQPQTITAPTSVKPYSVLRSKVAAVLQEIEGVVLTGSLTGGTTTTGTGTATVQLGPSSIANRKYTDCIGKAAGDVKKMQRCASLLGSG